MMSTALLTLLFAGCSTEPAPAVAPPAPAAAKVVLRTVDGATLGTLDIAPIQNGTRIQGTLAHLEPGSLHGFHVHEGTTCGERTFAAAGGHFAPDGNPHGTPGIASHAGDLGNIEANDDGIAAVSMVSDDLELSGPDSILNRTVILHAGTDDLSSQPSGDAGDRLACGIIEPS